MHNFSSLSLHLQSLCSLVTFKRINLCPVDWGSSVQDDVLHLDAGDWRKAGKRASTQGQEMSDLITSQTPHHVLHPPVLFIKSTEGHVLNMNVCMRHNNKQTW